MNWQDFVSYITIRHGLRDTTIERQLRLLRYITSWFSDKKLDITKENVEYFLLSERKRGLSNGTLNNYISTLKLLDAYYKDRGVNSLEFIGTFKSFAKKRPHIEVLSSDEIERILSTKLACQKWGKKSLRPLEETYLSMTMFFAYTGCRYSEAAELQVKYANLGKESVTFIDTKNGENRTVFISDPLLSRLKDEINGKDSEEIVFSSLSNKIIVRQNYSKWLKRLAQKAGIEKEVHPHLFRHSFITTMLENGVTLSKVKSIVGHRDIKSTDYYTHLADDSLRKAMYSHPLIRKNIDPKELIRQIKENIAQMRLENDIRLNYEIIESNNSFDLRVRIK